MTTWLKKAGGSRGLRKTAILPAAPKPIVSTMHGQRFSGNAERFILPGKPAQKAPAYVPPPPPAPPKPTAPPPAQSAVVPSARGENALASRQQADAAAAAQSAKDRANMAARRQMNTNRALGKYANLVQVLPGRSVASMSRLRTKLSDMEKLAPTTRRTAAPFQKTAMEADLLQMLPSPQRPLARKAVKQAIRLVKEHAMTEPEAIQEVTQKAQEKTAILPVSRATNTLFEHAGRISKQLANAPREVRVKQVNDYLQNGVKTMNNPSKHPLAPAPLTEKLASARLAWAEGLGKQMAKSAAKTAYVKLAGKSLARRSLGLSDLDGQLTLGEIIEGALSPSAEREALESSVALDVGMRDPVDEAAQAMLKTAMDCCSPCGGDNSWPDKFRGTPFYAQALQLELQRQQASQQRDQAWRLFDEQRSATKESERALEDSVSQMEMQLTAWKLQNIGAIDDAAAAQAAQEGIAPQLPLQGVDDPAAAAAPQAQQTIQNPSATQQAGPAIGAPAPSAPRAGA